MCPKTRSLDFFELEFKKNCYLIWNQHPRICENVKFCEKLKIVLLSKMSYFGIFGLEFENNIVSFQSAPSNLYNCKCCEKMKMPKYRTKNALLWYFCFRNLKNYSYILYQHTRICLVIKVLWKNENFGYFCVTILENYCNIWKQHPRICLIA